jgi:hypothetical protein
MAHELGHDSFTATLCTVRKHGLSVLVASPSEWTLCGTAAMADGDGGRYCNSMLPGGNRTSWGLK